MSENQIEQLEKLKSLYESGTISKEEMEKLKKDILFKTEINVPIQTAKKKPMGKYILISIGFDVLIKSPNKSDMRCPKEISITGTEAPISFLKSEITSNVFFFLSFFS